MNREARLRPGLFFIGAVPRNVSLKPRSGGNSLWRLHNRAGRVAMARACSTQPRAPRLGRRQFLAHADRNDATLLDAADDDGLVQMMIARVQFHREARESLHLQAAERRAY